MFDLGWLTFRDRILDVVDRAVVRRMVLVGVVAAFLAAALLVVLGLTTPLRLLPGGVLGIVLLAVAVGAVGIALVPLHPRTADRSRLYWSGTLMQAPEATERYFRSRGAPTIAPEQRDAVLRDGDVVLGGLVPDVFRGFVLAGALLLGGVGAWTLGVRAPVFIGIVLVSVVRTGVSVTRLGRVRRAMDLAELMPASPATPASTTTRRRSPQGSKIRLPGD